MTSGAATTLRLERTFAAPREAVFDAWTNPEVLRRWWAAGEHWQDASAELDLRAGGRYRLSMRDPDSGEVHTVRGEYREVQRPTRLVYSWSWETAEPTEAVASIVTVEFTGNGDQTRVVLQHDRLPSASSRDRHRQGWDACLDNLERRIFPAAGRRDERHRTALKP